MDFDPPESSGTDDDLPPTHQSRGIGGGRVTGNGRTTSAGSIPYSRRQNDLEIQIQQLEREAYSSVLRAFKAQSDAITWEKESLITELRKELRVTDDEHRVLLGRVNADDTIQRIREWRQASDTQGGFFNNSLPVHESIARPTVSAHKKQRSAQSIPSLSLGVPTPVLHAPSIPSPMHQTSSAAKRGASALGSKSKRSKSGLKSSHIYAIEVAHKFAHRFAQVYLNFIVVKLPLFGAFTGNGPGGGAPVDPLIGRKVLTRWPEDNNFYEAVITDYNPVQGLHALVYDINTKDETWEWVNLKEISPDDIRWDGDHTGAHYKVGRGLRKSTGRGGDSHDFAGRRGLTKKHAKKDLHPLQNGTVNKGSDDIEILQTDALIKEVERVLNASHPNAMEIEKAKKSLRDHEQSLMDAIARLADASDGESEEGKRHSHAHSTDKRTSPDHPEDQRPPEHNQDMAVDSGREVNHVTEAERVASPHEDI